MMSPTESFLYETWFNDELSALKKVVELVRVQADGEIEMDE